MRVLVAILVYAISVGALGTYGSDHIEAALRQLNRATKVHRNGEHLLSLSSLRTLKDPDLRPLFNQFSQHQEWTVQAHAVLGLAELSEEQTVDPWLIQQIAPEAREHVIAQALDDGLFQREQIESLLDWPLLETSPRLLLLADLWLIDGTLKKKMLEDLANNTNLNVAMFAALLSDHAKSIELTTQALRRATSSNRDIALLRTFQLIRQYGVESASDWLLSLLEQNAVVLTDQQRYWALYTLLTVDVERGLVVWDRAFPTEPERRTQVEYLLLLLESGVVPSSAQIERLQIEIEDPLLGLMVRAGQVNGNETDISRRDVQALVDLVERGHRKSTEWAFRVAENSLTEEHAELFYTKLATIPEESSPRRNAAAVQAFVSLIQLNSEGAWVLLRNTKDDSDQQQLLLLAMLQVADDEIVVEASHLRRIGLNKADVMALLLMARGTAPLQENDQEYLGIVAAGGGHLSPALETQAAWLYLKRLGLADKALAAVQSQ